MVYFIFGDNTYEIKDKVKNLKARFSAEQGDLNILTLSGGSLSFGQYTEAVYTAPFLGEKKLVIIKDLLLESTDNELKKKIAESIEKVPKTTVLIFVEFGVPDKRQSLYKALDKPGICQRIDPLEGNKLLTWIEKRGLSLGVKIDRSVASRLSLYVGDDLWRMENEIIKLANYAQHKKRSIESGDVDLLVAPNLSPNIFDFLDSVANGKEDKAVRVLNDLISMGENEIKILSMLVYQFRNFLIISDLKKSLSQGEIAKASRLHPFAVKKSLDLLRNYTYDSLVEKYFMLYEVDLKIKTGVLDPKLALALLVKRLSPQFKSAIY